MESQAHIQTQGVEPKVCRTLHLAFVCGGFNSTRSFYVLLKSILFYRTDKIHLHLMVDDISRTILTELFMFWTVPDLMIRYYNVTEYESDILWITSRHYSHRFGLMKLVFLSALIKDNPKLSRVMLLDTDMLALGNLRHIWDEFENFSGNRTNSKAIFGMVENQSDWYLNANKLSRTHRVWPALGRGFNSGLILVDLAKLSSLDWDYTWRQVTESEMISHLSTSLADQDIFNAVLRLHVNLVYRLPCYYNLQINDNTDNDESCPSRAAQKLIHWNSPYKLTTKNPKAIFYEYWYLTFRNWDAKLLEMSHCDQSVVLETSPKSISTASPSNLEIMCEDIRPRPHERLRTFLYFTEFELEQSPFDVTYVVHLSLDRLQVLDELASHWLGPISAAIYISELETDFLMTFMQNSNALSRRKNIGYHLVYRDHGFNYPINRLRNIAIRHASTPFVFVVDIDFLPSINLYGYLKQTIEELSSRINQSDPLTRRALVIPAFESLQYKFDYPMSKSELITRLNLGSISVFRDQIWPRGQAQTDYFRWRASTTMYRVEWKPEYEPFIVTGKNAIKFDERFVGFGWNKVESIMYLAAMGYEFLVLPEAFVIHKLHSASYDIMKHRQSHKYRSCIRLLRKTFISELRAKFPNFFTASNKTSAINGGI